MYEKEYKRGQIYVVFPFESNAGELTPTRPGLIVSNDDLNRNAECVTVAYLTTNVSSTRNHKNSHLTKATGRPAYVLCTQLQTVAKSRLGKLCGQLSANEMLEVDKCLDDALDLGYTDDSALVEKDREIEILKIRLKEAEEKQGSPDVVKLRVESDMWKGLYEKALEMLIDKKISADMSESARQLSGAEKPAEKPTEIEVKQPEEDTPKVDINTAKFDDLRSLGFSKNVVLTIINSRPFYKIEDLKNVPGVTAIAFNLVKGKICVTKNPKKPKKNVTEKPGKANVTETVNVTGKVNVNTASVDEIAASGLGLTTAKNIVAYRRKHGEFKNLEDLANVRRFGNGCLKKYRDKLEV